MIKNKQLLDLVTDGLSPLSMPRSNAAQTGQVPLKFGPPHNNTSKYGAYNATHRLERLGLTWADLEQYGLTIQSENHGVLQAEHMSNNAVLFGPDPAEREKGQAECRRAYAAAHNGHGINPKWTGKTAPSGLRLITIPEAAKASDCLAWTVALEASLRGGDPEAEIKVPPIGMGAPSAAVTGAPRGPGRPKATTHAIPEFGQFQGAYQAVSTSLAQMLAILKGGDDQAVLEPYVKEAEAVQAVFHGTKLGTLGPAAFDTQTIRTGVQVNIVPGTTARRAAEALLKKRGIEVTDTSVFNVVHPRMDGDRLIGWELQPVGSEPLARPIFVTLPNDGQAPAIKRVIRLKPVETPITFAAVPGNVARLGENEVMIDAVSGSVATVYFIDPDVQEAMGHSQDETFEVPVSELKDPSAV